MATKYGELFSDEYQKSLKEQFCYADTDPDYGDRLFFENSGGSLRLRAAVESQSRTGRISRLSGTCTWKRI